MGRKSKAKFELKGHALPGINQKSETANIKDGRSPSSAFQMKEAGDSPNKFLGLAAGALLGQTKFGKNAMSKVGNFAKKAGGALLGGGIGGMLGGGGGNDNAEAGKQLLKEEAKESMEGDSAMAMKLGPKNKLGGKLNEGTSPHQNI